MGKKGLKQMVAEAEAKSDEREQIQPVIVSGDALADMSALARKWTGHKDTTLTFDDPRNHGAPSPWAAFDLNSHKMFANVDALLLNPYRVLLTITPFRLRQEAVLTGAMLHEAAHARHSHWFLDAKPIEKKGKPVYLHTPRAGALKKSERVATPQSVALAKTIEEARIEGLMSREATDVGARGLGWTLRAMAVALLPPTVLSDNPDQMLMDIITSWVLRAGRQFAVAYHVASFSPAKWVLDFNSLLVNALRDHFTGVGTAHMNTPDVHNAANQVLDALVEAVQTGKHGDNGPLVLDRARDILDMVFPETSGGAGKPQAGGGCAAHSQPGEPDTGNQPPAPDEGEQTDEGEEYQPGTGDDELDAMLKEMLDTEALDYGSNALAREAMQVSLEFVEDKADTAVRAEGERQAEKPPSVDKRSSLGASTGSGDGPEGLGFRLATPAEREVKANANRFLRDVISPTTASRVSLSETPSASVDPAALAAWKAGGQVSEPRFFRRTHRAVQPQPPVKVGISVDISYSMKPLAYPSALLSYALAAAAVDLRNFAGRGVQIESTLVHWGTGARVIQANGKAMPGIYEHECHDSTDAMDTAHELIESQIAGFHAVSEVPENRLLVNFTDWILPLDLRDRVIDPIGRALEAGVNMISVVPQNWRVPASALDHVLRQVNNKYNVTGTHTLINYNPEHPEEVWAVAKRVLLGTS